MARKWSSGFELNSLTTGIELEAVQTASSTVTIQTSLVRSGTYALKINASTAACNVRADVSASNLTQAIYYRFYFRVETAPSSGTPQICMVRNASAGNLIGIRMDTSRQLILRNIEDNTDIGSVSSALSLDTWYCLELKVDTTTLASTAVEARIDGVSFASGTVNLATGQARIHLGNNASINSAVWYYDDVAINDDTGSFQNSWPDEGEVIHLRPNADGDNTAWGVNAGFAGADWEAVDEVTPNDATDYVLITQNAASNTIEDVNLDATPAAMGTTDTINVVQAGVRFRASSTIDPDPTVVARIKASASGTVEESSSITLSSTTWSTNAFATPRLHPLTLYDLPGASSTAWTKSDLDTTQVGMRNTNQATFSETNVSAFWLLVDHKPTAAPSVNLKDKFFQFFP